jgi:hypothetical protein
MVNNVTLTKTLGSTSTQLTIDTTNMSKSFVKQLQSITPAKATGQQETDPLNSGFGPNDTIIVDLLRLEIRYSIDGYISQGSYTSDTHSDVEDRKNDLENMFLSGGVVTFDYDDEAGVTGNIEKLEITKMFTDGQDNSVTGLNFEDDEVGYKIKMTIVKGVNYGS